MQKSQPIARWDLLPHWQTPPLQVNKRELDKRLFILAITVTSQVHQVTPIHTAHAWLPLPTMEFGRLLNMDVNVRNSFDLFYERISMCFLTFCKYQSSNPIVLQPNECTNSAKCLRICTINNTRQHNYSHLSARIYI